MANGNQQLPRFEGEQPVGSKVDLMSRANAVEGAYHLGDEMFFLMRAEVFQVVHQAQKNGLYRIHKIQPEDLMLLEGGAADDAKARLKEFRDAQRVAETGGEGASPIPGIEGVKAAPLAGDE